MGQKALYFGAAVLVLGLFGLIFLGRSGSWFTEGGGGPGIATSTPEGDVTTSTPGSVPAETPTSTPSGEKIVTGVLGEIASGTRMLKLLPVDGGLPSNVSVGPAASIRDENGRVAPFAYLRPGFTLSARGNFSRPDTMIASEVRVTKAPNILVYSPKANESVGLPLVIQGEARVFENQFSYRIKNADGSLLTEGTAMADSSDAGEFGSFKITAVYPAPKTNQGMVEVFEYSARDGSEINKTSIRVNFRSVASRTVQVYFGNRTEDPGTLHCETVYPAPRRIEVTSSVARRALEEMLKGPTYTESQEGFFTTINAGVKILSLSVVNGTARADFSETLGAGVAGSCRVSAIRAQIEKTLMQFPTVERVVISINGKSEEVLQP